MTFCTHKYVAFKFREVLKCISEARIRPTFDMIVIKFLDEATVWVYRGWHFYYLLHVK